MISAWIAHLFFWLTGARDEGGTAYGLMSGAGGALPDVLMPTAFAGWWLHNNCHQHRCWRIGRHPVGAAVRVCRHHHPELSRHRRLTAEIIADMHRRKP